MENCIVQDFANLNARIVGNSSFGRLQQAAYNGLLTTQGKTPVYITSSKDHLPICLWLALNGALNQPAAGHVDQTLFESEVHVKHRSSLLAAVRGILAVHDTFLNAVLRGSVLVPESAHHVNPHSRCRLPKLPTVVLGLVGDFLGVVKARQLRNANEFAAILAALAL